MKEKRQENNTWAVEDGKQIHCHRNHRKHAHIQPSFRPQWRSGQEEPQRLQGLKIGSFAPRAQVWPQDAREVKVLHKRSPEQSSGHLRESPQDSSFLSLESTFLAHWIRVKLTRWGWNQPFFFLTCQLLDTKRNVCCLPGAQKTGLAHDVFCTGIILHMLTAGNLLASGQVWVYGKVKQRDFGTRLVYTTKTDTDRWPVEMALQRAILESTWNSSIREDSPCICKRQSVGINFYYMMYKGKILLGGL